MTVSGIDKSELDPKVRPQDDLYRHVNGFWIDRTEIPADKARYGNFAVLAENAEAAVQRLITSEGDDAGVGGSTSDDPAAAADLQKIRQLYASFMDEQRLTELGATPLEPELKRIGEVKTVAEFVDLVSEFDAAGIAGGFASMFVYTDPGDPERYVLFLEQSGLGLPDESYYHEEQFAEIREKYRAHIAKMLELTGVASSAADAEERAAKIYELENKIADVHWNKVDSRDIQKIYNLEPLAKLQELTPQLDWERVFKKMGKTAPEEFVICQPSALAGIAALLTEDRLPQWLEWLRWHLVSGSAALLSPEISSANFEFYGTALTGATEQRERWRRGVSFTEGAMGEAVGRLYVAEHFDPEAKAAMDELVQFLIRAYEQSITELPWMSETTKAKALAKLEKFRPKIGYPDKWRDYSSLAVSDDLIANSKAVAKYVLDREFNKLGKPVDRDEWFMTPQTVNAYYNPGMNEIVFPAAILQPPFFDKNADMAANFGAIGAVIGHEIGHGFDDQGSQYDGDGKLVNWWTDEDRAAFEERAKSLINQYNELSPEGADGQKVNGELTIGENIGDLGGLAIAWKAYLLYLDGAEAPEVDGLSAAERFFFAWAQSWQQKSRPAETVRLLTIDPHSPNEFRCNQIVRNLDVFHEAFGVTPEDQLWLDPAERVTIW